MPNAIDTSYMYVFRAPRPRASECMLGENLDTPDGPDASPGRSYEIIEDIAEYRRLREIVAAGLVDEAPDADRVAALELALVDHVGHGPRYRFFPCHLLAWLRRKDAGTTDVVVVEAVSATTVTLQAHSGLEFGDAVRLVFPTSGGGRTVAFEARVARVWEDAVDLELVDERSWPLLCLAA